MVLVGGYTRLSGSGLSITEWKPIHGVVPPLSLAQWEEEFDAYRASPQYRKINQGMSLEEFKDIYWPEYWHRVLGRALGVAFLLPFAYFLSRGRIQRPLAFRLCAIFALGGLQGFAGWYMVQSGLVDDPHVSHLRLALHLGLAFLIFACLLWAALDVLKPWEAAPVSPRAYAHFSAYLALLCLQIILGAFVAGLKGGLAYNTFPTMNGAWIAPEAFAGGPFHDNIALIQFAHRWAAVGVALAFFAWAAAYGGKLRAPLLRHTLICTGAALLLQCALGVFTLIHHVPMALALKHQMTALALFGLSVAALHGLRTNRTFSSRKVKTSAL
jgi:cytochrome c oxidase assembly protein subunit 15